MVSSNEEYLLETPVGFEPTILELCRLLQLTTLPWCQRLVHYRGKVQKASFSIRKRMSSRERYIHRGIYRARSRSGRDRRSCHTLSLSGWTWVVELMDCIWPRILWLVTRLYLRILSDRLATWYIRGSSSMIVHSRAQHIDSMWWSHSGCLAWWWGCSRIRISHQVILWRVRVCLILELESGLQYSLPREQAPASRILIHYRCSHCPVSRPVYQEGVSKSWGVGVIWWYERS